MKVTLFHLQEASCRDYEVFELGLTLKFNLLLEGKRNAIKLHCRVACVTWLKSLWRSSLKSQRQMLIWRKSFPRGSLLCVNKPIISEMLTLSASRRFSLGFLVRYSQLWNRLDQSVWFTESLHCLNGLSHPLLVLGIFPYRLENHNFFKIAKKSLRQQWGILHVFPLNQGSSAFLDQGSVWWKETLSCVSLYNISVFTYFYDTCIAKRLNSNVHPSISRVTYVYNILILLNSPLCWRANGRLSRIAF